MGREARLPGGAACTALRPRLRASPHAHVRAPTSMLEGRSVPESLGFVGTVPETVRSTGCRGRSRDVGITAWPHLWCTLSRGFCSGGSRF